MPLSSEQIKKWSDEATSRVLRDPRNSKSAKIAAGLALNQRYSKKS